MKDHENKKHGVIPSKNLDSTALALGSSRSGCFLEPRATTKDNV
jgi:hypothetical protein